MALEDLTGTGKFIAALNPAWPVDDDWVDEGDNHIRGIKNVLKNTFPASDGALYWSSAQARFPDGSVALPGISWTTDTDSGWFHAGNDTGYSVNGVSPFAISSARVASAVPHRFVDGVEGAPGISWSSEPNSGFFKQAAGTTACVSGGVVRWSTTPTQLVVGTGGTFDGAIGSLLNTPLKVASTGANVAAIGLNTPFATWMMTVRSETSLWFGADGGQGPAGISGFSAVITKVGVISARNFTTVASTRQAVEPMVGALGDVLKLRGVRYVDADTGAPGIGVGVEELEAAFPELVEQASAEIGKGLNLMGLAGPLIEAIRELEERVRFLESKCAGN